MYRRLVMIVTALALFAAACGTGTQSPSSPDAAVSATAAEETTSPADEGFPVTIDAPNGAVTIEARPERIVSIAPTSTEVLFAVGAGDQVVAVDDLSNFPANAPVTDLSGFTPSVEAIASFDPDLVVLSFDPADIVAGLEAIGIPVILHGTAFSVDDAYAQWEQVGQATGHTREATDLIARTKADIESAFESLPEGTDALSYYFELDTSLYSVTSATFIGGLLAPAGMRNIADEADTDGYGYPQLTAEHIIDQDPSLILLADTKWSGQSAATLSERPGWDSLTAVAGGAVVELDDDVASRWGPRIADLVEDVVGAILNLDLVGS